MMPAYAWWLVVALLMIPSAVVLYLKVVMCKEDSAINGTGGCLFAFLCLAAAIWVIHDRLG